MRLRRLQMQAIGPFAGHCAINFDQLSASGLYLLDGPTGSGKSTIIDAITWGLYGSVAGGDDSSNDRIRSTHAEPDVSSYVDLVFTVGAGTYRVRRTPQWTKPGRKSAIAATAKLWKLDEGALESEDIEAGHVLETKARDTGIAITGIIGLNKNQFVQTIILPQGKFAEFLKLNSTSRTDLLEQIFDTSIYRRFAEDLAALASDAGRGIEARQREFTLAAGTLNSLLHPPRISSSLDEGSRATTLSSADTRIEGAEASTNSSKVYSGWAPLDDQGETLGYENLKTAIDSLREPEDAGKLLESFETLVKAAGEHAAQAAEALTSAEAALAEATGELDKERDLEKNLERRGQLLHQQGQLEERSPHIDALERQLTRDGKARQLLPYVNAARDVEQARSEAISELKAVSTLTPDDVSQAQATLLKKGLDALRSQQGSLKELEKLEQSVSADTKKQQEDTTQLDGLRRKLAATEQAASAIPDQLAAAQKAKEEAHARATTLPAAQAARAAATQKAAEFADLVGLRAEVARARTLATRAGDSMREAQDTLQAVTESWISSTAANLALQMREGQPCPVCGSINHPAPAPASDSTATRKDVDRASQTFDGAKAAFDKASTALDTLRGRAGAMEEAHSGESVESLNEAIARAKKDLAAAQRAVGEEAAQQEKLTKLADQQGKLAATVASYGSQIAALDATIEGRNGQITANRERVAAGCGQYPDIAARLKAHNREIAAAEAEHSVVQGLIAATSAETKAQADLCAALEESEFASTDAVRGALVNATDAKIWATRISNHRDSLRDVAKELSSPPLGSLTGAETADVADAVATREEASAHAQRARSKDAQVKSLADQSRQRFGEVQEAHAAWTHKKGAAGPIVRLAGLASGNRQYSHTGIPLATYVLQQRFEQVVGRANEHLSEISLGRYELQTTEEKELGTRQQKVGLGLQVLDHSGESGGDAIRATRTLSGGETFYVSLALALALADVVCAENGGIQLDTLMIDEGFGSLDESTLDQVMQLLTGLASGGRSVALVSHVSEMKKMVSEQINVIPQPDGSSHLEIHA